MVVHLNVKLQQILWLQQKNPVSVSTRPAALWRGDRGRRFSPDSAACQPDAGSGGPEEQPLPAGHCGGPAGISPAGTMLSGLSG